MDLYYCRLRGRTKIPLEKDFINKATNDRNTVKEWLHNGDNIGLVCAKSGIVVVDVDIKHGGMDAWNALCLIHGEPDTRTQLTPSGGKHYLFKAKSGARYKGKIQNGLDIRYNHQIVVAPSVIGNKSYSWEKGKDYPVNEIPPWVNDLIEMPKRGSKLVTVSHEYLKDLIREVKKYPMDYNDWCMVGMAIHSVDSSNSGLDLFIEASSGVSYQEGDEEKCVEKWRSFSTEKDNMVTVRSIIHLIRKNGGVVPSTCTPEDFDSVNGQESGWYEEGGKIITHSIQDCIDFFNQEFRYYLKGGDNSIINISELGNPVLMKRANFASYFLPRVYRQQKGKKVIDVQATDVWLADSRRREIDEIVFAETHTDRQVNLFTGMPKFEVNDEPRAIFDLLEKSLVPSAKEREWLLLWFAHIMQKPFEKTSLVPVHITQQGTGKGILYDIVMRGILGKYFVAIGTSKELTTNFNKHLANKFLTLIDEASWKGNKEEDGLLKKLTGSHLLMVEEKFGGTYEVNNPSRYAITSNNDDAVCISVSNRRYVVLKADETMSKNVPFFHGVLDQVQNGDEIQKLGNYLCNLDITKYHPYLMPDFKNGATAKFKSQGSIGEFWQEVAENADIKCWDSKGLVQKRTFELFQEWKKESGHWDKSVSSIMFWRKTQELSLSMEIKTAIQNGSSYKYFDITPEKFFDRVRGVLKIDLKLRPLSEYYMDLGEF